MIIIADAGPLLHLYWVDALAWALPPQEIVVVEAVRREVDSYAPAILADQRLRRVFLDTPMPPSLANQGLDAGEEEAIAYALTQPVGTELVILCDDRDARRTCQQFALPVTGSLGLIIAAFREGRVSQEVAATALRELPGRGRFYGNPSLIAQALAALDAGEQA